MAAALIYMSKHVSCTDQPCVWNSQKESKQSKQSVESLFGSTKNLLKKQPTTADYEFLHNQLKENAPSCGLFWLMEKEPTSSILLKSFDFILKEAAAPHKATHIIEKMKLSDNEIMEIFNKTVGQRSNSLWGVYRKGRITSSNFGLLLKGIQNGSVPTSTLKALKGEYNCGSVKAVQWGINHEAVALQLFENFKKVQLKLGGLYLHPSGLIGCSPDALLGDNALIEIKCPASKLHQDLASEIKSRKWYLVPKMENFCFRSSSKFGDNLIHECSSEDLELNMKHPMGYKYYHQIQGMLHLMDKDVCSLMIWTPNTSLIVPIFKEPTWVENIEKIISFYKNIYIYTFIF